MQAIVSLDDVHKRYPGAPDGRSAVDGVTLTIAPGEIVGLLGPNGAGKTTVIEMIVGLRRPTSGTVRTVGVDPVARRDDVRRRVAVQPQGAALFVNQTVAELARMWARLYSRPADPTVVLEQLGLTGSADVLVKNLSGGQRQRLLVCLALIADPELLVLDEPSTGLDPNSREELWSTVQAFRDGGGTVLLSTHLMDEAEVLSDRVAIMDRGTVVACGSRGELVSRHCQGTTVSFTLEEHGADVEWLRERGDVLRVTAHHVSDGTRVEVRSSDADRFVAFLAGRGIARQLSITDAGLATVFRELTGRPYESGTELVAAGTGGSR